MNNAELERKIIIFFQQLEQKKNTPLEFSHSPKIKDNQLDFFLKIKSDYEQITREIQEYQLLKQETTDPENQTILEQEVNELEEKKTTLIEKIKQELISQIGVKQNVLMEIRPGAGGVEAGLFAHDLYRMYVKFARSKGWKIEETEIRADGLGNFSFASFLVRGKEVYKYWKNILIVHLCSSEYKLY